MKNAWFGGVILAGASLAYWIAACASHSYTAHAGVPAEARKVLYYRDPMHPSYKSDRPGTAPDCGMALVPVFAEDQLPRRPGETAPAGIFVNPDRQQQIGMMLQT